MTAEREALLERVRAAMPKDRPVREVPMFGGVSFMVEDSMAVSAGRGGGLLVRADPARRDELLGVPGANPAVMGERTMGPGWIAVSAEGLTTDDQVAYWVHVGLQAGAAKGRRG